jgi:hypothetical protein
MLNLIPADVFTDHLLPFLDVNSRVALSCDRYLRNLCVVRFANIDSIPVGKKITVCIIDRLAKKLSDVLKQIDYVTGYKRYKLCFKILKHISFRENLILFKYMRCIRDITIGRLQYFNDKSSYNSSLPKRWASLLQRTSRKGIALMDNNPLVYDFHDEFMRIKRSYLASSL